MRNQKDNVEKHQEETYLPARRELLKKIAVGVGVTAGISLLPERWSSPVITTMALPVHAETSGPLPCEAPAGCYSFRDARIGEAVFHFNWAGGCGTVKTLDVYTLCCGSTGSVEIGFLANVGVAANVEEAKALGISNPVQMDILEPLSSGCYFFRESLRVEAI
ncbi:hypothetical protein [Desulforhopalus singaporensis]|uniref:Uncharacterized protein n=1 Tax=Desulforhopalus singaporensis TaxID=91360 RepID=A0A1H0VKG1_9BACT|nr:hypothetical protein [Desulforhopalus singaporensis]SDP78708.1 hypothetical protein SAMN05660330_04110 [Desulforhopalus singaporensis]